MMRLHVIFLTLGFFIFQDTGANTAIVTGNFPTYAGDILTFYKYKDYITYTPEAIAFGKVDPSGSFKCEIPADNIIETFLDVGIFRGMLIVEPGKAYQIELPDKIEKSQEDKLNPFFQPVVFYIQVGQPDDRVINNVIGQFTDTFNRYYDNNIGVLLTRPNFNKLNADLDYIYAPFRDHEHPFVHTYIHYRFGILRHLALQFKINAISDSYFLNKEIQYDNPAYMEFFNQVYDRYFIFYGRTEYGKQLYLDIAAGNYTALMNTLGQDEILSNDTLKELVVLKNLYDGFYDDDFSRSALLFILDSLITTTKIQVHKTIGLNVKEKVTKLMTGYAPPAFALYDENNHLVHMNDFRGEYIYLNFCISSSYSCLREYELLKDLHIRHKKYIHIVTIVVDEDFIPTLEMRKRNNYNWTFLHYGNQPDLINQYDVRGYPTYYLIGPDGKLIFSPSPGPLENFEYYLFKLLKDRGEL